MPTIGRRFHLVCRFLVSAAFMLVVVAPGVGMSDGLVPGGAATVVEIVDGDTLHLDDGEQVRLVGLQAPKLPLGRPNFKAWPLGNESKAALARLTLGKRLRLGFGGRKRDRHGRLLAHLHTTGGTWIQGEMLRLGWARVYTFHDNRRLVDQMLGLEQEARRAKRGIWGHAFYRLRSADNLRGDIDSFQLVEGRVRAVATVKGRTYLNFGNDWRRDFTIMVARKDRRRFSARSLEALDGRLVRVRGWLRWYNGPMIDATHPEQIEVLE